MKISNSSFEQEKNKNSQKKMLSISLALILLLSQFPNIVSTTHATTLNDFESDNFNNGIINSPFQAKYPTGSEDFIWMGVQEESVYALPIIQSGAGASSYTYLEQELTVSRTGTFDFQVEIYKYAYYTASDLRLMLFDEDENLIAQVGVYDAWASSSYKELGISYDSNQIATSYYSGALSSDFRKYVRVWRDSSNYVHTSIGGVERSSANNVNPIKYVKLRYYNYWPHSYDSELQGRNDRFWFDNFIYSHALPLSFASDTFSTSIGTFWEQTFPTGSEDFDWVTSSNRVVPKILSTADSRAYTYLQQTITNPYYGPFQVQVDAYKYAYYTASDMRLEVLNSDFEVIAQVGIYDAWASSSYKIIGNVWDNTRTAVTYTSGVYTSEFDGTFYVSRSIGNALSVNIGGSDLSITINSEGIKAIRLRYHNYWPHSYDSELVGSTTKFWFDNFIYNNEIPTSEVLLSDYVWDVNSYIDESISNDYYDYRDTVNIQKPLNYYARIEREFVDYSNSPFEATVSLRANSLTASSYSYAPSLIISYNSNTIARLSIETDAVSYNVNGVSYYTSHSTALNTWYDLKIKIKYSVDLSGYNVEYLYKLTTSGEWISLSTTGFSSGTLGAPTIIIGTPRDYGSSNSGGTQDYYFANFDIKDLQDQDNDGISDINEYLYSDLLKIDDPDTDGDGLLDGEELNLVTVDHYYEILTIDGTNSITSDLNSGYSPPGMFEGAYYSDPLVYDTDGDGLNDFQEKLKGSSPNKVDTDSDGVDDIDDSQPTIVDNFGPSFVNLHGRTFTFGDGAQFTPTETVAGEGIYFFAKFENDYLYVVMDLHDDRGLDQIQFNADGFWPWQEIRETENLNGVQSHLYKSYRKADNMMDWDITIKSKDIDGNWAEEISFTAEGSVSGFFRDVGDFVLGSLTWIAENIGGFLSWVGTQVEAVINAVYDWMVKKAEQLMNFVESKVSKFADGLQTGLESISGSLVSALTNYQAGTLDNIRGAIVSPVEISALDDINAFLTEYEEEIMWAKFVLDLIVATTSPLGMITFAIGTFGSSILSENQLEFLFDFDDYIDTLGSFLGNQFVNLIDFDSGDLEFPTGISSLSTMDLIFNDLSLITSDSTLITFITTFYETIKASTVGAQQGLSLSASPQAVENVFWFSMAMVFALMLASVYTVSNDYMMGVVFSIALDIIGALLSIVSTAFDSTLSKALFAIIGFGIGFYGLYLDVQSAKAYANDRSPDPKDALFIILSFIGSVLEIVLTGYLTFT